MSGARVPFLSRLSPDRRSGSAAVRAALAPRYSAADLGLIEEQETEFITGRSLSRSEPHEGPRAKGREPEARKPRGGTVQAPAAFRPQFFDSRPSQDEPSEESQRVSELVLAPASENRVPPLPDAAAAPSPPDHGQVIRSRPTNEPFGLRDHNAPLGPDIIAQRALESASKAPEVVQVTIDRLDVRIPSPPPTSHGKQPSRPRSSTLSLSDYLKQRDRSGSRGPR